MARQPVAAVSVREAGVSAWAILAAGILAGGVLVVALIALLGWLLPPDGARQRRS